VGRANAKRGHAQGTLESPPGIPNRREKKTNLWKMGGRPKTKKNNPVKKVNATQGA